MNNVRHWYLIAYDVHSPQRLQRVHRFLRSQGYAVQESVFAWSGNLREMAQLRCRLSGYIKPSEDDLRLYRLATGKPLRLWGANPFLVGIIDDGYPPHVIEPLMRRI